MFKSVLIANRGEIACRIMRTARRLGIRTIAVYSDADRDALHVRQADQAVRIGPAPARESYLNIANTIEAARGSRAEAIHPGYGFLAENADFAAACASAGIIFIGPPVAAIRGMGLKDFARNLVAKSGVPVLPGYAGEAQDIATLQREAGEIGYPVLVKPVAGGGGKGMRQVSDAAELADAIEGAQREALGAFGDGRLLIEKYVEGPRHIEVQIFADGHGDTIHLYERDCSLQRRHQKVVEEAPAPGMTEGLRARMTEAAIAAAKSVGYVGAGTVEFLVEGGRLSDTTRFYFLEMNTRLQVEHPVTEGILGLDLVEWQLQVAAGGPLPLRQSEIRARGHAIEARLYAEDPAKDFLPSPGRIVVLRWPGRGIRVDSGVEEGDRVSPDYDPMLAKLIATGATRNEAIQSLRDALADTLIAGPRTNLAFLHELLGHVDVAAGRVDTGLIGRMGGEQRTKDRDWSAIAVGVQALIANRREGVLARRTRFAKEKRSPWDVADAFALGPERRRSLQVLIDGEAAELEVAWNDNTISVSDPRHRSSDVPVVDIQAIPTGDGGVFVVHRLRQTEIRWPESGATDQRHADGGGVLRAPLHGKLVKLYAVSGRHVRKGERIAVIEAMKMEHVLQAPFDGVVSELGSTGEGAQIAQGALLAIVEADKSG